MSSRKLTATAIALGVVLAACAGIDDDPAEAETAVSTAAPADTTETPATTVASNPTMCVEEIAEGTDLFPDQVTAEYTDQWSVEYADTYKVVTMDADHGGAPGESFETYVLVQCGTEVPPLEGELADAQVFTIPLERFVESGGGTYGSIEALGLADRVVGWRGTPGGVEHSPSLQAAGESGSISEIGSYGDENYELLATLEADGVTSYGVPEFSERTRDLGIPVFQYSPFSESPLGSAEQLKVMALFFNEEAAANELFDEIETAYTEIRDLIAAEASVEPTVLIGNISGDDSFSSRPEARIESLLVADAGGTRVLADEDLDFSGFQPTLSLETAITRGGDADYWFSMAYLPSEQTAEEFIEANPRNASFAALERGDSFHRFGRAEDYFATAAIRVDELLTDLASILHPELFPDHTLTHLQRIPGTDG